MGRDYASIQTAIWGNPDVRALPPLQQWLYLQMWTHPDLSYVGVLDWRPGRTLAPLSSGTTGDFIRALMPGLQQQRFAVVDEDTEEVLLRSYLRHDGLLKQPKLAVSMTAAYAATGSNVLRGVIVHELLRLRDEYPDWKAWAVPQVLSMLKHPAIDPMALPVAVPPAEALPVPMGLPLPVPLAPVTALPERTTTSTTTATEASLLAEEGEQKGREIRLPADWVPATSHFDLARQRGLDITEQVDAFRLHAEAHDRRAVRWNAAFTMWLKKARSTSQSRSVEPGLEWMSR